MKELKIEKEQAKKIYERPESIKAMLEERFGPETFRKIDYKDLNTFDALCKVARGITEAEFEAKLKDLPVSEQIKRIMRMEVISEGINQEWEADPLDTTQKKWTPIFKVSSVGLDFSFSNYYYGIAFASVGFPFAYKDEAHSTFSGTTFSKYWIEFITRKTL
jgi:hypothetical protein